MATTSSWPFRAFAGFYADGIFFHGNNHLWPAWLGFLVLSSLVFAVLLTLNIGVILVGPSRRFRMYLPPILLAIFFTGPAPIYWSPTYDKLWLQVKTSLVVLISLVLSCIEPARSYWVHRMSMVAVAILVVSNMAWLVPSRRARGVAHSREAEEFSKLMSPRDLLVVDWSPFSTFYCGAYSKNQHIFYFIPMASNRKVSVIDELRKEIRRTSEESGNVCFLGLVDQERTKWKSFIGDRVGLPYDSIAEFREKPTKVKTIDSNGKTVTLYRLGPIVPTSVPSATP